MTGGPQATDHGPRPFAVDRDTDGLRVAFSELLEEGFQRGRIAHAAEGKNTPALRDKYIAEQMDLVLRKRTLAVGYYTFAAHIFRLDAEREVGLPLEMTSLAAFEGAALCTLSSARAEHKGKHPACSRCGALQESRFHGSCTACKADFTGRKK